MDESVKLYNLDNLISMIGSDSESIKEFVDLFLDTSVQTMNELNSSYEAENISQVGAMAHKLKSSIDLMGISSLKTDIRSIEKIGKELKNVNMLKELISNLNQVLQLVHKQMKEEFK